MLLCRSCSLLTPYSLLSTAHYSFVHCFTACSIPLIAHLYHCSLFTVQLEWHFYRDTAQDSHSRSVGSASCQVVTTAIIQHLYSNEHRTNDEFTCACVNTIIVAPAPLVPNAVPVIVSCQVTSFWVWICGYKAISIIVCTIFILLKFAQLGS